MNTPIPLLQPLPSSPLPLPAPVLASPGGHLIHKMKHLEFMNANPSNKKNTNNQNEEDEGHCHPSPYPIKKNQYESMNRHTTTSLSPKPLYPSASIPLNRLNQIHNNNNSISNKKKTTMYLSNPNVIHEGYDLQQQQPMKNNTNPSQNQQGQMLGYEKDISTLPLAGIPSQSMSQSEPTPLPSENKHHNSQNNNARNENTSQHNNNNNNINCSCNNNIPNVGVISPTANTMIAIPTPLSTNSENLTYLPPPQQVPTINHPPNPILNPNPNPNAFISQIFHTVKSMAVQNNGTAPKDKKTLLPIIEICKKIFPFHLGIGIPLPCDIVPSSSIRYQHIWEDQSMTIGIFILPPGALLTLHNHPRMSVVSRLLYGSLHVRAMDIVSQENENIIKKEIQEKSKRNMKRTSKGVNSDVVNIQKLIEKNKGDLPKDYYFATKGLDGTILAPATLYLTPDYCNIHEFRAGAEIGCAILDILSPPYNEREGRDCVYYKLESSFYSQKLGKDTYLINSMDSPPDLQLVLEEYQGTIL